MPRGENPNSRANLTHRFNEQTARKAQKKSVESHKLNNSIREAGKLALDDATLHSLWQAIIERAKQGNVTAFKTIYEVMGEAERSEPEAEIRLAYLPPKDEPEPPPEDIPEE